MKAYRIPVLLLGLIWLAPARAAGPFELFGVSPRGKAMAGAQTAVASDYSAAFYNPAGLTRQPALNWGLGAHLVQPNLRIELEQPLPADSWLEPEEPHTEGGLTLGFDFPVGGKLGDHLALGLALYLPATEIARIKVPDPAVPHYYLYQGGAARMEVMPALAVRWLDWLATGFGLRATGGFDGPARYAIDPIAGSVEKREFDTGLVYELAPTAGLTLGPFWGLRLGLVYRGALGMPIAFPNELAVAGLDIDVTVDTGAAAVVYSPHTVAAGLSFELDDGTLIVAVDLQYMFWSLSPDPSAVFTVTAEGEGLETLGLGDALNMPAPGMERTVVPGFKDTLIPRVGVEWRPLDILVLRGGYFFQPTHIPDQTTGSNYVDSSLHAVAAGIGFAFRDPWELFEQQISIDLSVQAFLLTGRSARKADANDPVGNWRAGGQLFEGSLAISYTY